jgi:glycosyltransferase involved in cell wall biosynthesis
MDERIEMMVSIITVVYNGGDSISKTIDSVLSQSYNNIEYIIIDGKSVDNTFDIITSYKNKISTFVSEPDNGIYDAMNKGISLSNGDVIGILNSDDFYSNKDVISLVIEKFNNYPKIDMILGNVVFVRPNNLDAVARLYSSFKFKNWKIRFGFSPAHPAAFIKKSAYLKVGKYSEEYKISADFEWFSRAFFHHHLKYEKINRNLVTMREGGVSTSGFKSYLTSSREQLHALKSNNIYSNIVFIAFRLPLKFFLKYKERIFTLSKY